VDTVETPTPDARLKALQQAFIDHNALQCGYCTPGMLMAALELRGAPARCRPRAGALWISGNYCRCTGYHAIVDAVCAVLDSSSGRPEPWIRPGGA
jgi:aerobic-type carbon monoxide dehydrogenase small subunit (CoxS/CutS family)